MIIKVNMAATDLWRLIAAYKDGELAELGVVEIHASRDSLLLSHINTDAFSPFRIHEKWKDLEDQSDIQAS